jgi:DNA (cytosine-5)-methyltransferase 1
LLRRSPLSKSAIEHSVTEATRRTFNALYLWVIEWIADPLANPHFNWMPHAGSLYLHTRICDPGRMKFIPVIDLFAGPGGLSEGFSSYTDQNGKNPFRSVISVEKDPAAHRTLLLRNYYRLLKRSGLGMDSYYAYVRGEQQQAFTGDREEALWRQACDEALLHELGKSEKDDKKLEKKIKQSVDGAKHSIVIGGPPCQAYSLIGRARNKGICDYRAEDDHRHFLYKEYLRIINLVSPSIFVMENVKGILSAKVGGTPIFENILRDLAQPYRAMNRKSGTRYVIRSFVQNTQYDHTMDPSDIDSRSFIIRSEQHGIPQNRHRVILLGIREDLAHKQQPLLKTQKSVSTMDVIGNLPRLRSHVSRTSDLPGKWEQAVLRALSSIERTRRINPESISAVRQKIEKESLRRGANFVRKKLTWKKEAEGLYSWLRNDELGGVLNHEARGHMESDLGRYVFASLFSEENGYAPRADEFPPVLWPEHNNWESGKFKDRFKVQVSGSPSSTITSHIAKDGHYYIHPDPSQCRSFTVREAARVQTFPDDYFFEGNRTEQYTQVGNAVPPLLASSLASIANSLIS